MSRRFGGAAIGWKHLPPITDRQFTLILYKYGVNVTLRNRVPIVENPTPCPCIANDDVFNQIRPDCPLCGGTGIVGGEAYRDRTIKIVMQPDREFGFMGSSVLYTYPTKMERVWEGCYVAGNTPVDIADFIIDSYEKPNGETVNIEYEVYDKQAWIVGQGPSRKRATIYYKLLLRKTEYAKTVSEVENY